MNAKNTVSVTILGQTFQLRSDASMEEAGQVADFVNRTLDELGSDRTVDTLNLAVMALLNVSGAYLRMQREQDTGSQEAEACVRRCLERLDAAKAASTSWE